MTAGAPFEELLAQLSLPLAQLARRAHNAKTPPERHYAAFYLWEATLKLLASAAVIEYAEQGQPDPSLVEPLRKLTRPALGDWRGLLRLLLPLLAQREAAFLPLCDLLGGDRPRSDLPRLAGLDGLLREVLAGKTGGKTGGRSTVRVAELLDRLVEWRNKDPGHGAAGMREAAFYERTGPALLAGAVELLGGCDVLAGSRLALIDDVRRLGSGDWLVEWSLLSGEVPRRQESLTVPEAESGRLPRPGRVYLHRMAPHGGTWRELHPLVLFDPAGCRAFFLNARRGRRQAEYLCYTSGESEKRDDLGMERRALLARALGVSVGEADESAWATRSLAEEPAAAEEPPAPRRTVGEFELLSELGRGGMGVVYRAWQPSLGRQVALKCLVNSGDARAEARFRREIRALGRVEHPHLVKVFTSGSEADQWFYAMELVEGVPLSAVCDRLQTRVASVTDVDLPAWREGLGGAWQEARRAEKPLAPLPAVPQEQPAPSEIPFTGRSYVRHVVELVRQVAEAAHALHEAGIIHRDVKPGNILVSADGTQAVLMDLGLAQLADDVEGRLTRTRQFVGTLRYASPQQVLAVGKLDRRTDVYALGATLWELLTLHPLYGATDETPTPELMERIQRQEPERPRRYHPGLPRDLEAIVLRCLEKDLSRRYATARDVADDLGRFLAGEPVRARPVSGVERAFKWARRHPATTAAYGLLLLALLLGVVGGGVTWLWRQTEAARREANNARDLLAQEKQQTEAALQGEQQARQGEAAARELAGQLNYLRQIELAYRHYRDNQVERTVALLADCPPERRQWEWYYVNHLCHAELLTFTGHHAQLWRVAYSPDGKRIASASADSTVKIWSPTTGKEELTLRGHTDGVASVAFSPDGARLASSGYDHTIKLWEARTGKLLHTFEGHSREVNRVVFSPDGTHLATAASDGTVKIWDVADGRQRSTLKGDPGGFVGVAFSPSGTLVAAGGFDGTIRVWDAASGQERHSLPTRGGWVWSVAFSPDGRRLAGASSDRNVRVWDTATWKERHVLRGHTEAVLDVAFSPDGRHLASSSSDCTVRVWDAITGQDRFVFKGHTAAVRGVAFSPDGAFLASASNDETARVWHLMAGKDHFHAGGDGPLMAAPLSPEGGYLAVPSGSDVLVWDLAAWQEVFRLEGHQKWAWAAAYRPDGKRLATAASDGTVAVWDTATGKEVLRFQGDPGGVVLLAFSPDGARLAGSCSNQDAPRGRFDGEKWTGGTVAVWDAATGKRQLTLQGLPGGVVHIAFSPDGKRLAGACDRPDGRLQPEPGAVIVWDLASGGEAFRLEGHADRVTGVAYSPDGKHLASSSCDRTVRLWDAETGRPERTLRGHLHAVTALAFSADGRRLASASLDRTLRVWDTTLWQECVTLEGLTDTVGLSFSGDGRRLLAAALENGVQFWETEINREALDNRLRHWQLNQTQEAETLRFWFASAFYLDGLLAQEPDRTTRWFRLQDMRLRACAELGRWDAALTAVDKVADSLPASGSGKFARAYFEHARALLLLGKGDQAGYRRACARMMQDFGRTEDGDAAALTADVAVLLPGAVSDTAAVVRLARAGLAVHPDWAYRQATLGAALYRNGELDLAVKELEKAREKSSKPDDRVRALLFLALCRQRLGQTDEARACLEQADSGIEAGNSVAEGAEGPTASWDDRLYWRLLRQEAEALRKPRKP
jgi:WD40 repeat protein/serine/threonine protein kinase